MKLEELAGSVHRHFQRYGHRALSVAVKDLMSRDQLAACATFANGRFRESTVQSIRALGYEVILNEPPDCHALILFDNEPTLDELELLVGVFPVETINQFRKVPHV
jgi:hypothetical protein